MRFSPSITALTLSLLLGSAVASAQQGSSASLNAAATQDQEPPALNDLLPLPVDEAAAGQGETSAKAPPAKPRLQLSESFAINLVNRLVERGVLTQADAADMIALAKADAQAAQQEREQLFTAAQVAAEAAPASDDEVRVTYVPETVKDELRSQVKDELLREKASLPANAAAIEVPEWVARFHPHADFRVRFEHIGLPPGNDSTGSFPNFNVLNTGHAYDVSDISNPLAAPQYNTTEDRNRTRLRLRFGADLDLENDLTLGIRLGTGDSNNPVSGNQSFGGTNLGQGGNFSLQGGNFSKYAIWLDRAFLRWDPTENFSATIGRFDNPFFSTTTIFSDDLGFDGLMLQAHADVEDPVAPFVTLGSFPVFNTDLNFASNQSVKFKSYDKWLNAAQVGVNWKISRDWNLKAASALYDFHNIEGQLSTPFTPRNAEDPGDTDHTRPSFAQKGNTYMALRRILPDESNQNGQTNQFQYYGLATPFRVHSITGRLNYDGFEPFQISLLGEYLKNIAFDQDRLNRFAINNQGRDGFEGGDTAYHMSLRVGKPQMMKRGDWFAHLGYHHIESDAVVDGFNDQNFGGGGTNMKGYSLGASMALSPRLSLGLSYFNAAQIAGPQFRSQIIQLDLSAKF